MMRSRPPCCDTTTKILLVIFNFFLWAFGVAILGIGIWIKTDPELSNLGQAFKAGHNEPVVEIVTWLFIGAGIFVFAVGVVGIIGIFRESKIMMGFYITCIFVVFLAETGAGVYVAVRKDFIIESLKKEGETYIKRTYDETSVISRGFNYVQVKFECCGMNDFMDYKNSTYLQSLGSRVKPNAVLSWACCNTTDHLSDAFKGNGKLTVEATIREQCMVQSIAAANSYEKEEARGDDKMENTKKLCNSEFNDFNCKKGCVQALEEKAEENFVVMLAIGIAFGVCQLILLFLALCFCLSMGKDEK